MTDEQVRAEFETWASLGKRYDTKRVGDRYVVITTQCAWEGWQAARGFWLREAARIAQKQGDACQQDHYAHHAEGCDLVRDAIRAAAGEGS